MEKNRAVRSGENGQMDDGRWGDKADARRLSFPLPALFDVRSHPASPLLLSPPPFPIPEQTRRALTFALPSPLPYLLLPMPPFHFTASPFSPTQGQSERASNLPFNIRIFFRRPSSAPSRRAPADASRGGPKRPRAVRPICGARADLAPDAERGLEWGRASGCFCCIPGKFMEKRKLAPLLSEPTTGPQ